MKINRILVFLSAALILTSSVALWADELTKRVDFVSKRLGCEFPYMVAEDSETGRFYAETRLRNPQRLKLQGFPDAQSGNFVSIRESLPGEYGVKVVAKHRMLDGAQEKLFVMEYNSAIQSPADIIASGIIIKGVITNFTDIKDKFSASTYLQLVEISSGSQGKEIIVDGFLNLESNLPKMSVSPNGSFEMRTTNIKPGSYWLYLQNFKPATPANPPFEAILAKGENFFQIFITDDVNSLIFDCGNLAVKPI